MSEWEGRKVLVTGATGFIGSSLTEALVGKGAEISVLARKDSPRLKCLDHLKGRIAYFYGDVRDKGVLHEALKNQEIIYHLAAITQVIYAVKNPVISAEVNFTATLNLLEFLREEKQDAFLVYASSDKVYGEPNKLPIDESNLLLGKSPYDATKLAGDRICYAYHVTYGQRLAIFRGSNAYGRRDANILRAVPDFILSLLDGRQPAIRGHGRHQRDFMYIDDIVSALTVLYEKNKITNGDVFNFGTSKPISVYDLALNIIKAAGQEGKIEPLVLGKDFSGEIDTQYVSYRKANEKFGWQPKYTLEEGLKRTIEWYRQNTWFRDVIRKTSEYYGIDKLL
ncbi:MAG: SDR family NAD(P)-dependent oxidoreductase [Candidatus Aenigmarchaeota archaeon]|nr:SDR family NAD(P)-dependent oxidoreductase [Candidatus Aenigmarchaeota archaeon]